MKHALFTSLCMMAVLAAGPAAAEKQKPTAATLKDLENRKIEVRTDQPLPASSAKAMENYRTFLEIESADPALRAEALRRLADLSLEASEVERAEREQIVAESTLGADAIELYAQLVQSYPDYHGMDAVLYQLARAHESNAQPAQALAALNKLVAKFPTSRLTDEAQFRRGELLFSGKRYAEAQQAYQAVTRLGSSSTFYEQSLYKEGWTLFKLGRNEESLDRFGLVLDRKLIDPQDSSRMVDLQQLSRPERELIDDTFRVASIMFSDMEGPQSAADFARPRGSGAAGAEVPYSWLVYARLGDLYIEKQRYQDAAKAYEAFVQRDPVDPNAPLMQVRAIEAYRKGQFASLVLAGKQDFVERYGPGTAFWNGRDPAQFPAVVNEVKTSVMELARHHHAQAQKLKAAGEYQQAARWYRSYLDWFGQEQESADINFLLAESLFESRQFSEAAQEYEATAYKYSTHVKAPEAGYAALLAYAEHEKHLAGPEKESWHAKAVESGLKFASTWPEHKEVPVILTRTARELFDLRHYDRAVDTAQRVLALQPPVDQDKRRVALTVIAHSHFDQGKYAEAEATYIQLRAAIPPDDKEVTAIAEKLAASVYKQAEEKQAAGDSGAAVDIFLRVAQVAPESSTAKNAEYDAAAALVSLKDWPRAINVLNRFRNKYPDDLLVPEATASLAVAYAETGQFGQAAVELEKIADFPDRTAADTSIRREALWQAAEFYQKVGDVPQARRSYQKFVQRHSEPFDQALEARQQLAELAMQERDLKARDRWLKDIIDSNRLATTPTERSNYLAAKAALTLAQPLAGEFADIKLRAPLKKNLTRKRKAMERALKAYGEAAQYGVGEVTTAATYSMAELYRTLAKDLMSSERPAKLAADELEQYDLLLEEQAFPFEEKAIEIHEANTARAADGVYDEWVRNSFAALAELQPARYAKSEPELSSLPADTEVLQAQEDPLKARIEATPADAAVATRLGLVYRLLGRFPEAEALYQKALTADPNYTPALLSLGVLYDLYLQNPQRALEFYERYKKLSENDDTGVANWIAELKRRLGSNPQPTVEAPSP